MDIVTKLWDYFYLKVGCLMSMLIALDPRGIDFAYPSEFERRSAFDISTFAACWTLTLEAEAI